MKKSPSILIYSLMIILVLFINLVGCKKEEKLNVPTIASSEATDINYTTASCNANISNDGGSPISSRGTCWSLSPNPTILDSITIDGNGLGTFKSCINNLIPSTTYYLKVYATNAVGTAYGSQITLKTRDLNTAILDISKDYQWNYWVIAKDGSYYLVKLNNDNRPTYAYFKPDRNSNGYCIFFNDNGLPLKLVIDNNIILFSNYRGQFVDAALISSNGNVNIQRDLKISVDMDSFYSKSFISDLTFGLNLTSKAIGIASCVGGLVASSTGVGAPIGVPLLVGCASTVVGIAATIFPDEVGAIGDNFKVVGLFASAAGCALGSIPSCVSGLEKTAIEHVNIALNSLENENVTNTILELKLPSVTTSSVISISSTTASSGGNITSDGGSSITARGICYSTSGNSTLVLSKKTSEVLPGLAIYRSLVSYKGHMRMS